MFRSLTEQCEPLRHKAQTPHLADVKLQFPDVSLHRADLLLKGAEREKGRGKKLFPKRVIRQHSRQKIPHFPPFAALHPHQPYLVQVIVESLKEKRQRMRRSPLMTFIFTARLTGNIPIHTKLTLQTLSTGQSGRDLAQGDSAQ